MCHGPMRASGPTWCEERSNRSRKGKAYERRDMGEERPPDLTGTSGSGRRTQRPQVHARAEQIQTVFQTCAPGPEIIGGGAPGNPTTTLGRGWERTSKGAYEECPHLGVLSAADFVRTTARGSLGTFHPWKVPRPGAKYPPSAPSSVSLRSTASPLRGEAYKTSPNKPSPPRGEGGIAVGDDG